MLSGACGAGGHGGPRSLLDGKLPLRVSGIDRPERMTDGRAPIEGDRWNTSLTSVWQPNASAVFDLGQSTHIDSAAIVGDNNDDFELAASEDGETFTPLWAARRVAGPGMRLRQISGLGARGRYLRLTTRAGDPAVSVGEVLVYAQPAAASSLERVQGEAPNAEAEHAVYALGSVLIAFMLLMLTKLPRVATTAAGAVAAFVAGFCACKLVLFWPLPQDVVSLLRAVIALVASVGFVCWTLLPRSRALPVQVVLAVLALLSLSSFFNFGKPWFRNAQADRATLVHTFDMRVYFPVAKYFRELRFDGLYLASVSAYAEAEHVPLSQLGNVQLRDLTNNEMLRVRDVLQPIEHVKERFTEARWREFVRDMRFFWKTMGPGDYLGSLRDHGGNATPVWLSIVQLIFAGYEANERNLTLTGLLDPLLLVVLFIAIGRSFGLRALLACAIVFGATDLPMFGSNWWGSTLRFDWMVSLGLAACALKTQRFGLAGALLAYAGLVRAFPAAALFFTLAPLSLYVLRELLHGARPAWSELRARGVGLAKLLLGAAATGVLLVGLSGALLGFEQGWGGWFDKIAIHTEKANVNHVGLRTIFAFDAEQTADKLWQSGAVEPWARWETLQRQTFERRAPLVWVARVAFLSLCALACYGASLERAALVGLMLIPVLLYPANYYCHYIFLLPLLAAGLPPLAATWLEATLLGMCIFQYLSLSGPGDVRFYQESLSVIGGFVLTLLPLAYHALRGRIAALQPEAAQPGASAPAYVSTTR